MRQYHLHLSIATGGAASRPEEKLDGVILAALRSLLFLYLSPWDKASEKRVFSGNWTVQEVQVELCSDCHSLSLPSPSLGIKSNANTCHIHHIGPLLCVQMSPSLFITRLRVQFSVSWTIDPTVKQIKSWGCQCPHAQLSSVQESWEAACVLGVAVGVCFTVVEWQNEHVLLKKWMLPALLPWASPFRSCSSQTENCRFCARVCAQRSVCRCMYVWNTLRNI